MKLGKLVIRLLPFVVVVWALRTSAVQSSRAFQRITATVTTVVCQMEMRGIARALDAECRATSGEPGISDFGDWLRHTMKPGSKPVDCDNWGEPYELEQGDGILVVISSGPDHELDTPDDIRVRIPCRR